MAWPLSNQLSGGRQIHARLVACRAKAASRTEPSSITYRRKKAAIPLERCILAMIEQKGGSLEEERRCVRFWP